MKKCLNCSCEFIAENIYKDELGWHTACTHCEASFDIDINKYLIPQGTKVKVGGDWIGIVDGSDIETTEDFESINYFVCPLEHTHKEVWSDDYVACLRDELEICNNKGVMLDMGFQLEHMDEFDNNEKVFWLQADKVSNDMVKRAKAIDGEDYSSECFGVCVLYNNGEYSLIQDNENSELYYIDNDGVKHWLPYKLNDYEMKKAIDYCINNK